jgi:hypothetical protein
MEVVGNEGVEVVSAIKVEVVPVVPSPTVTIAVYSVEITLPVVSLTVKVCPGLIGKVVPEVGMVLQLVPPFTEPSIEVPVEDALLVTYAVVLKPVKTAVLETLTEFKPTLEFLLRAKALGVLSIVNDKAFVFAPSVKSP